jgi:hypothetical protein
MCFVSIIRINEDYEMGKERVSEASVLDQNVTQIMARDLNVLQKICIAFATSTTHIAQVARQ